MSILLESLNQSSTDPSNQVPNLSDSHFDDDMLSDEWLLRKIKLWRGLALMSIALLVASWTYFAFNAEPDVLTNEHSSNLPNGKIANDETASKKTASRKIVNRSSSQEQTSLVATREANNRLSKIETNARDLEQAIVEEKDNSQKRATLNHKSSVSKSSLEEDYHPQKRLTKKQQVSKGTKFNATRLNVTESNVSQTRANKNIATNKKNYDLSDLSTATNFDELSEEEQSNFPLLEINSYAVSSNAKKSFVVLNNAFYGEGETIAPYLVLIAIRNDSIYVDYKDQLIKKKY